MIELPMTAQTGSSTSTRWFDAINQLVGVALMSLCTLFFLPLYHIGTLTFVIVTVCFLGGFFWKFPICSQTLTRATLIGCLGYACVFVFDHISIWYYERVAILDLVSLLVSLLVIKVECTLAAIVLGSIMTVSTSKRIDRISAFIFCIFVSTIAVISIMTFEGLLPCVNVSKWLAQTVW